MRWPICSSRGLSCSVSHWRLHLNQWAAGKPVDILQSMWSSDYEVCEVLIKALREWHVSTSPARTGLLAEKKMNEMENLPAKKSVRSGGYKPPECFCRLHPGCRWHPDAVASTRKLVQHFSVPCNNSRHCSPAKPFLAGVEKCRTEKYFLPPTVTHLGYRCTSWERLHFY